MPLCPAGLTPYTVREGDTLWRIAQRFSLDISAVISYNPEVDPNKLTVGQTLCLPASIRQSDSAVSESGLSKYLRMLWSQHVYWTRLFLVSTIFNLPDLGPVTQRLLRNPKDFADALRPIYGDDAAAKFADLLTAHLSIAGQLVKAMMSGDTATAEKLEKQWYANADEIAGFLSRLNPHWPYEMWRELLYSHLAMTKQEVADYISRRYADSVAVFDRIEKEALEMADVMTAGIKAQFPGSFVA